MEPERRNLLKAGLALLAAPLAFLRRSEATTVHGGVDMASGPDCTALRRYEVRFADGSTWEFEATDLGSGDCSSPDTPSSYDRLGDTVGQRTVEVVFDEREFHARPGRLHSGHPDCRHCHGRGTVIDEIGGDGCVQFKHCPACQWELKRMGAIGWRVTSPSWGYPDCEWCRGTGGVLNTAVESSGGIVSTTKQCPMCKRRCVRHRYPPEIGPDGGFIIPERVVASMKRAGFPV